MKESMKKKISIIHNFTIDFFENTQLVIKMGQTQEFFCS